MTDAPDLSTVVTGGNRRKSLEALRDHLVTQFEFAAGKDLTALNKELRETMRELDELPAGEGESKLDDLATRRTARRKEATGT